MANDELIARLQKQAESESEASKMWAQAKSLRQHDHEPRRDDLYSWSKPEQTLSWEAAQALAAADARIAEQGAEIERLKAKAYDQHIADGGF